VSTSRTAEQAERVRLVQDLRRSSASSRHKTPKMYRRRPKHAAKGWS
jgi:hypothetical protein